MTIKTKFSDTDPKLKMLIKRRNLSKGAIKNYDAVFREVYELFGDTPSDMFLFKNFFDQNQLSF